MPRFRDKLFIVGPPRAGVTLLRPMRDLRASPDANNRLPGDARVVNGARCFCTVNDFERHDRADANGRSNQFAHGTAGG
eukprot:873386-Lingulodinium_polyedra.AAC.3